MEISTGEIASYARCHAIRLDETEDLNEIRNGQSEDLLESCRKKGMEMEILEGIWYIVEGESRRIIIPETMREDIIKITHEQPM